MVPVRWSWTVKLAGTVLPGILWCLLLTSQPASAATIFPGMSYCNLPPLPGVGVKPNVLLMLDNSASMWDLAYSDNSLSCSVTSTQPCSTAADCPSGESCVPRNVCYDESYDDDKAYTGYFDPDAVYGYDFNAARFVPGCSLPSPPCPDSDSGCAASTKYLYVAMSGSSPRTATTFQARGNFLNWLTTSKLDLEKQALTGGKFVADSGGSGGVLVAESRGCQGKRFVKVAPGATGLTFAVTGPVPPKPSWNCSSTKATTCSSNLESLASPGGATSLEIYDAAYNKKDCTAATRDWLDAGTPAKLTTAFRTDMRSCVGGAYSTFYPPTGGTVYVPNERQIFADAMFFCFSNQDYATVADGCSKGIQHSHGDRANSIARSAGDAVCGSGFSHIMLGNNSGFLGRNYDISSHTIPIGGTAPTELTDYCGDLSRLFWTDPSAATANSGSNIPAFVFDLGIAGLRDQAGNTPVATSLSVKIAVAAPPIGVVQQYSGDLNLGVMVFNDNGTGTSECKDENVNVRNGGLSGSDIPCVRHCKSVLFDSGRVCLANADCSDLPGYSCQKVSTLDGARVLAPVGSAVGDHTPPGGGSPSVVYSIDTIAATTWSPLSEALYTAIGYFAGRSDMKLQSTDFDSGPASLSCQANHLVLVTDGISTADRNGKVTDLVKTAIATWGNATDGMPTDGMTTTGTETAPSFMGSYNVDDLAWIGRHQNIRDFTKPVTANRDIVTTHVIYTGPPCGTYDSDGSCHTTDEAVPEKLMQLTTAKGGGRMVSARNPAQIPKAFQAALGGLASAASGTDPVILSTELGNAALFLREQFTPQKSFDGGLTAASWVGEMQGLWYFLDSYLGASTGAVTGIREETDQNLMLTLTGDRIVDFSYDSGSGQTMAHLTADTDGDGVGDLDDGNEDVDAVKTLWRAGKLLWARDLIASPRTIYTPLVRGGSPAGGSGMMSFSTDSAAAITPYLNLVAGDPSASTVINFAQGFDFPDDSTVRSRSVTIDRVAGTPKKGSGVWKLGDIIYSTPQAETPVALGGYHLAPPAGYGDLSYASFTGSPGYQGRGMVFVGANDGMLHAFRTGTLNVFPAGSVKASLTGDQPGKEEWAYLPTNALPYLKYLTHPDYRHLYHVDGKVTLVDASIGDTAGACSPSTYWSCPRAASGSTWRSVLIVGMGLGGAGCSSGSGCLAPPAADPYTSGQMVGYSSYSALDVTDPAHPVFLWEFSDPSLGFSTTGPAILRVGPPSTNGRWFAVFGSGPDGSLDASHRFLGTSTQQLKLFVVDLRSGQLLASFPSGLTQAFAGSLVGAGIDADRWNPNEPGRYQDDGLYVGYSQADSGGGWTGGVLRLMTREDQDPNQWRLSKVAEGTGPVTGGIGRIQDRRNHNLWLYFGSGRYFFTQDDLSDRGSLFAVKEPCYNVRVDGAVAKYDKLDGDCTDAANVGGLVDQSGLVKKVEATDPGWRIDLYPAAGGVGGERVLTAPVATRSGSLFFATFQPNTDTCQNGDAYLWGVSYATGGPIPDGSLKGKAMVQLSTGAVGTAELSGFAGGTRRGAKMTGIPGGVKIISNSGLRPVKRILHMKER
ncbi:hypothetical protein GMSM_19830 [Geomonas sp. Red276]